jgi:hypothetical protein
MRGGATAFKVKDVTELQHLLAEHVDSIEPGLRILDAAVVLGETTVDLIALDKESVLVLMAIGFEADDEMLLRVLDAYAWCLESGEAVRRLYPGTRLSGSEPPRIMVVAERVSEPFLRRLRHLRVTRADCLEYSIGLRFERAGGTRAVEPPLARTPPLEPPRFDLAAERGRPAPAPPAAATGGQIDEWKIKIVRDYLQREFPTSVIYDFYAHDRTGQMFHLQDSYGDVIHAVCVAEPFLAEHAEGDVRAFFETHKLGRVIRQAGQAQVTVASTGVRIERV